MFRTKKLGDVVLGFFAENPRIMGVLAGLAIALAFAAIVGFAVPEAQAGIGTSPSRGIRIGGIYPYP
ncbi:MAG TPA: hypothetical protein VD736_09515 [Nitrososphaera sp.]|nr:hypothetical protein [Nitrososphaera sp.]